MRFVSISFLIFRILAALWIAAVGVFAGLQTLGYIAPAPKLEPIAWTVSLAIIGLESIGSIIRERVEVGRSGLEQQLDRWSLLFVLEHLRDGHGAAGLLFEDLGVSVWVPTLPSRLACAVLKRPRDEITFRRLNRFRPQGFPQQSSIKWTGKMGTLGECWRTQRDIYWNAQPVANKYGDVEISAKQFEKLSSAVTRGFSREQFIQVVGKYSEVRAVPIMHSDTSKGKMVGVLTIDRVYNRDDTSGTTHIGGKVTLRRAEAAASGASASIAGKHRK